MDTSSTSDESATIRRARSSCNVDVRIVGSPGSPVGEKRVPQATGLHEREQVAGPCRLCRCRRTRETAIRYAKSKKTLREMYSTCRRGHSSELANEMRLGCALLR